MEEPLLGYRNNQVGLLPNPPIPEEKEATPSKRRRKCGSPPTRKHKFMFGSPRPRILKYDQGTSKTLLSKPSEKPDPSIRADSLSNYNNEVNLSGMPPEKGSTKRADSSSSVVRQAFLGLSLYLTFGVLIYSWKENEFSGLSTSKLVDALYFCIVTMCTIGYGDITPNTTTTKLFSCAFVLIGFGFIDVLLSGMVSFVLDRQEALLLSTVSEGGHESNKNILVDLKKGRMRIRMKVTLAFGVVVVCIGVGATVMYFLEKLPWVDALYLSCMSVTTVGYGDHAFKTLPGRLFASAWLPVSTLAVARSFLYLAEAHIDKRHRLIAKWVLEKEMTFGDLVAADLDNDGCVSKSDFVVYKLKQMGKIEEKDILAICSQFDKLDIDNIGKIKMPYLMNLPAAQSST